MTAVDGSAVRVRRVARFRRALSQPEGDLSVPADRPITVRLPEPLLRKLMGLSIVDDGTLAEQIRTACAEYAERREAEPDFATQVENARTRQNDVLSALTTRN